MKLWFLSALAVLAVAACSQSSPSALDTGPSAAELATEQAATNVLMPAPDTVLPTGELVVIGRSALGDAYADLGSFVRSGTPGGGRGTVVLIRSLDAQTLRVAQIWIDCRKQMFALDDGPLYDASGDEIGRSALSPSAPISKDAAFTELAQSVCGPDPTAVSTALPTVADWRAALVRSKQ